MPHRDLQHHGPAVMEPLEQRFLLSGGLEYWQTQFIDPLAGDIYTQAVDFNDVGQVLGLSGNAMGELHPFIWQDNVITEISSAIPGSQNPGFVPDLVSMNNAGLVLGNRAADTGFPEPMGYLLDPSTGQVVYVEPLQGDARTYAIDLADDGKVLAISEDALLTKHVIVWDEGAIHDITEMVPLDEWDEPTQVVAINELGQVLGQRPMGDVPWERTWRAFTLDTFTGAITDLAPAGEDNCTYARRKNDPTSTVRTFAGDIDDLGRVIGISTSDDYWSGAQYDHVCVWEEGFPTEITFFLPGYDPNDPLFVEYPPWVAAINNSGQILGTRDRYSALPADDLAYIMTPSEVPGVEVSIEKCQTLDIDGTIEYGYRVHAADAALSGLQLTTPWGELIDVANWLPQDWAGQYVVHQDGVFTFEADTDQFEQRWFELAWAGLTIPQWDALETGQMDVTTVMMDIQWTGAIEFSAIDPPADMPNVVFPSPDETGVPLSPTFQWDQWTDAPETGLVYLDLRQSSDGQSVYSLNLPADSAEVTVPGSLQRNTTYGLSLGFLDAGAVMVNDLSVSVSARAVCHRQFTTANGTVSQVLIERSQSDTDSGSSLGYSIEAAGTDLQRLQAITPWGELFTSNGLLPAGWDGEDFAVDLGDLYFAAFTATDGQHRLAVRWSELLQDQWEALDEDVSLISVLFDGGLWQSAEGFDDLTMPDQVPALLSLSNGQTGVGVLPTLEWSEWDSASFGDIIRPWVSSPDPLWPGSRASLPSYATNWQPSLPLDADTTYEAGVEFVQSGWDCDDGTEVITQALTRRLLQFTTMPIGVSQMDVRRTIDYGAAGTALDDAYEYEISVAGLGLTEVEVIAPWGATASTADLLDMTGGVLAPDGARVGPFNLEVKQMEGITYVSYLWRGLSDDQWSELDSGLAEIQVLHEEGSWSASGIGLAGVAQHLREPGPTHPMQDGVVEQEGFVDWQPWLGAPVDGYVAVDVMQLFGDSMWALAHTELPAGASSWTLSPMAAGVAGMEVAFVNETSSEVNGTPLNRSSQTRSSILLTVVNPSETTRVHPTTGHVYVLTPEDCSWAQAKAYARLMGGDLVTINDAQEETWLGEQYCEEDNWETYWIGLNDLDEDDTWAWSSGEDITYTAQNWSPGTGPTISYVNFSNQFGTLNSWWYASYPNEWWQMPGILEFPAGWTSVPFDDHGNDASNATAVVLGEAFDAALSYTGDADWFAFDAVAGQSYEILISPPSEIGEGSILVDSSLRLYDTSGLQILAWSDDGGIDIDNELLWCAPANGTYYAVVDAAGIEDFGEYSLSISPSSSIPDDPDGDFQIPATSMYCYGNLAVAVSQLPAGITWKDDAVLRLLDISDGLAPVEIGRYAMAATGGSAVAVGAGTMFLADGQELIGLDASGQGDPAEMWSVKVDQAEAQALALEGNYLYAGTVSTSDVTLAYLEVYDVSNPSSPVLVGRSEAQEAPEASCEFSPQKLLIHDGLACVLFANGRTVGFFDVSDPSLPVAIDRFELAASNPGQLTDIALVGETLWATVDHTLMAIRLSDSSEPSVVRMIELPGRGGQIRIAGGACYVGCVGLGVTVVDISDPTSPELVLNRAVPAAAGSLAIGNTTHLYVPTTAGQVAVFTVDPAAPTVDGVVMNDNGQRRNEASAITFDFDTDVVISYEALRLFDDLAQQELLVPGGMAFHYNQASHTVRWDLSAMALPAGRYSAMLSATEVTATKGTRLDGNEDGLGGDDFQCSFVVTIRGDADMNGVVDAADYIAVKRSMGVVAGATWENGDSDSDGDVDWYDLQWMTKNFGLSLETAPAAAPAASQEPLAVPVSEVPGADALVVAARALGNRFAAGCHDSPILAAKPANALLPVNAPGRLGLLSIPTWLLLSLDRTGQEVADVLTLARPWRSSNSARRHLTEEPGMIALELDMAGKPRKGPLDLIGPGVLAGSRKLDLPSE